MLKRVLLALPFSVLIALPALADQWVFIGDSTDGRRYYVDFDSLRGQGSRRSFSTWIENPYTDTTSIGVVEVDCQRWRGRVSTEIAIGPNTSSRPYINRNPVMDPIEPETMMEAAAEFICDRIPGATDTEDYPID